MVEPPTLDLLATASSNCIPIAKLPTNTTTGNHAVHRWFNFIAGFSPEFVQTAIDLESSAPDNRISLLDPFSGCGTAPLTARLLGLTSIAYEAHPFFAIISEAKANSPTYWAEVEAIRSTILAGICSKNANFVPLPSAAETFLSKIFRSDDLLALLSARAHLQKAGFAKQPLAILILSRILDYCCFAATDGIYKAPTSKKQALPPLQAFNKVFATLIDDVDEAETGQGLVQIHAKSSENMKEISDNSISLSVTSPPYLNNFDFAEMTRMYLYFWGIASSWAEITNEIRSRLIVNTTTALRGHKDKQEQYRDTLSETLRYSADAAVNALCSRRKLKAGKKEYNYLVYPYLSQMQDVLRETHRVLKPGAPLHMMVSDAALYGVHVPTPQWLAQIMAETGFVDVSCDKVRPRGHRWLLEKREGSSRGLGEYYVYGRSSDAYAI